MKTSAIKSLMRDLQDVLTGSNNLTPDQISDLVRKQAKIQRELQDRKYLTAKDQGDYTDYFFGVRKKRQW